MVASAMQLAVVESHTVYVGEAQTWISHTGIVGVSREWIGLHGQRFGQDADVNCAVGVSFGVALSLKRDFINVHSSGAVGVTLSQSL